MVEIVVQPAAYLCDLHHICEVFAGGGPLSARRGVGAPERGAPVAGAVETRYKPRKSLFGAWRSLVAHLLWEQDVGGSNPLAPTMFAGPNGGRRHGGNDRLILDSKWRIASSADLFDDELDPKGSLTHEQVKQVDSYIAKFKGGQS